MTILRPVWAEISLTNLKHNLHEIRRLVGDDCQIMLPVKADGYGHGAIAVSQAGLSAGADQLAVSMLDEAITLREAGLYCPILILGWTPPEAYETMIHYDVSTAIYNQEEAAALAQTAKRLQKKAKIHIKIDTGMSRLGLMPDETGLTAAKAILSLTDVVVEGIFSHFSKADETDKSYAQKQLATFCHFVERLEHESGCKIPFKHIANSAAVIDLPESHLDMVRPGIIFYGQYPSYDVHQERLCLKSILSLKARVSRVQWLEANTPISYGGIYTTDQPLKVATIPIGYADGYDRRLSNKGSVLYKGQRLPIIGRICMDQLMIDATAAEEIKVGDAVTLIGRDNDAEITVGDIAKLLDTITYEISCKLAARIPRIYLS